MRSSEHTEIMTFPGDWAAGISSGWRAGPAHDQSVAGRPRQARSAQPQRGGGAIRGEARRR
eukprot:8903760-Pyramimonas_sp.AAC.1